MCDDWWVVVEWIRLAGASGVWACGMVRFQSVNSKVKGCERPRCEMNTRGRSDGVVTLR